MKDKLILLSSDQLGKGDEQLGRAILENFFNQVKQLADKPAAIFCMNSGVFTMTDRSLVSLQLQDLEKLGVPIYGCKTCIDTYGIENELTVGEVSGMNRFVELASMYEVITIS